MRFKFFTTPLLAAAFWASVCAAQAQGFPAQPIRIIAPFSPGSGPDVVLRIVAEQLSSQWKQPVLVDNKPGASGLIAIAAAKAKPPTGYDLLMADVGHMTVNPAMFKTLPYDPKADFAPISTLFTTSFFVAISSQSKVKTFRELIASAAADPGQVSYGSFAVGSIGHLGGAQVETATNTKMMHVAFKEASQLYTSIAAGDVTWGMASIGSAGALLKADKLRFLAVADSVRSPFLPQIPTIKEAGGPDGISSKPWVALFAPKGTPPAVVNTIHRSLAEILKRPDIAEKFGNAGLLAGSSTPAELSVLIDRDAVYYGALVKRTGANSN